MRKPGRLVEVLRSVNENVVGPHVHELCLEAATTIEVQRLQMLRIALVLGASAFGLLIGFAATARADEIAKCVTPARVRAAVVNEPKTFLRSREIERLAMLQLQQVKPEPVRIMPDYDAGLLVERRDGTGILLKGFGMVLCREQELSARELVHYRILLASFTKKSKATRPRTRMPRREARRARAKPPIETPAVRGLE